MSPWSLIGKEILHRKVNFALGVVSVSVAVGVLVSQLAALKVHDIRTEQLLGEKQAQTEERIQKMEDDYRKIMKLLGFNLLILPKGQQLGDFYAEGYASKRMPEEYVQRLAESNLMTIRHLLPLLEQKVKWTEMGGRTIILVGTRGEVPYTQRAPKEPMLLPVPRGKAVVGHEIWKPLGLQTGDKVQLLGRQFEVSECNPERGNKDDITIWIELKQAQELLGLQGQINAIQALKCFCHGSGLSAIRKQIAGILPDTQVVEFATEVLTRAEARDRAAKESRQALEEEKAHRAEIRREKETFASWLLPLVVIGCTAWVSFLALGNVRDRKGEIAILRALGVRSRQIFLIFLSRAAFIGMTGAALGYAAGLVLASCSLVGDAGAGGTSTLFNSALLGVVIASSVVFSTLAGWVPALLASQSDPASILREQ